MLERVLREILTSIANNPHSYPPLSNFDAESVIKEVRSRIVKRLLMHKDATHLEEAMDNILSPNYRKGLISAYYYLVHELGLERDEAVNLLIEALEILVRLKEFTDISPVHRPIVETLIDIIDGVEIYNQQPLSILEYASELGLVYWDGEKWNVTELGRFLLRLPPYEMVKALLTLEIVIPRPSTNRMTIEFLKLLKEMFSRNDTHMTIYIVNSATIRLGIDRSIIYSWLSRLKDMGILFFKRDRVSTNQFALQLLDKVLDIQSNPYYSLLSFVLSQSDPPLIISDVPTHIEKLKDNPLISNNWSEINQALDSYINRNYHATLRTILPVIERILREIAVKEGITGTDKGLNTLIEMIKGHKFISARTENLIKALGRDLELHGLQQLNLDQARFYAELALMTLLELVRDYERHKLLHQSLQRIAQELNLDYKELLRSYPDNRNVIHVQFLSDKRFRITVHGRYVYEITYNKELHIQKV